MAGEQSLSDKLQQGTIAVARGGPTGSNVLSRRFRVVATHKPLRGIPDGLCLNLHFVESQEYSG